MDNTYFLEFTFEEDISQYFHELAFFMAGYKKVKDDLAHYYSGRYIISEVPNYQFIPSHDHIIDTIVAVTDPHSQEEQDLFYSSEPDREKVIYEGKIYENKEELKQKFEEDLEEDFDIFYERAKYNPKKFTKTCEDIMQKLSNGFIFRYPSFRLRIYLIEQPEKEMVKVLKKRSKKYLSKFKLKNSVVSITLNQITNKIRKIGEFDG